MTAQTFQYQAIDRQGALSRGVLSAADEASLVRRLSAEGLTVLKVSPAVAPRGEGQNRALKPGERVLVLRQLGLMLEAGVSLLEALETVAQVMLSRKGKALFQAAFAALRRCYSLGHAL